MLKQAENYRVGCFCDEGHYTVEATQKRWHEFLDLLLIVILVGYRGCQYHFGCGPVARSVTDLFAAMGDMLRSVRRHMQNKTSQFFMEIDRASHFV